MTERWAGKTGLWGQAGELLCLSLSVSHLSERSVWQDEGPLDRVCLLLPTFIDPTPGILVRLLLLHQTDTDPQES